MKKRILYSLLGFAGGFLVDLLQQLFLGLRETPDFAFCIMTGACCAIAFLILYEMNGKEN